MPTLLQLALVTCFAHCELSHGDRGPNMERDTIKGEPSTLHDAREIQRTLSAEIHVQARDPGLQEDFPSSRTSQPPSNVSKMDKVMARRPSSVLEADTPITVNHSDHINANSSRSAVGQLSDFMDQGYSVALDNANFRDELQELVTTKYRIWKKNILLVNRQKVQCLCYRSNCAADGTYTWAKCAITHHDSSTTFSVAGRSWTFEQPCDIDTTSYRTAGAPTVLLLENWLHDQQAHQTCGSEGTIEGTHFNRVTESCDTWDPAQKTAFLRSLVVVTSHVCKTTFEDLAQHYKAQVSCEVKAIKKKFPRTQEEASLYVDPESQFKMCIDREDPVTLPVIFDRREKERMCECTCPNEKQLSAWSAWEASEPVKAFIEAQAQQGNSFDECEAALEQKIRDHAAEVEQRGAGDPLKPLEWTRKMNFGCQGACNGECDVHCAGLIRKAFTKKNSELACGVCWAPEITGSDKPECYYPDPRDFALPSYPDHQWRKPGETVRSIRTGTFVYESAVKKDNTQPRPQFCEFRGAYKQQKGMKRKDCKKAPFPLGYS